MAATAPIKSATNDRAFGPGRSGLRKPFVIGIYVVLVAALAVGLYGVVSAHRVVPSKVVGPSVDRTVTGTAEHPALTIVGDYVEVKTPTFSALALITGPLVPGEGLPFQADWTTCTWKVTLTHVTGRIPLALADFDSIDHTGLEHKMGAVPGQAKLPAFVTAGHSISFQLRAVMPVGEGLMRWAPDGNNIVAKWDYQVEND